MLSKIKGFFGKPESSDNAQSFPTAKWVRVSHEYVPYNFEHKFNDKPDKSDKSDKHKIFKNISMEVIEKKILDVVEAEIIDVVEEDILDPIESDILAMEADILDVAVEHNIIDKSEELQLLETVKKDGLDVLKEGVVDVIKEDILDVAEKVVLDVLEEGFVNVIRKDVLEVLDAAENGILDAVKEDVLDVAVENHWIDESVEKNALELIKDDVLDVVKNEIMETVDDDVLECVTFDEPTSCVSLMSLFFEHYLGVFVWRPLFSVCGYLWHFRWF